MEGMLAGHPPLQHPAEQADRDAQHYRQNTSHALPRQDEPEAREHDESS